MHVNLDQHMMVDLKTAERMAKSAGIKKGEKILEIGAGGGRLTMELARTGARIAAIEMDHGMAEGLKREFSGRSNVEIIEGNALKLLATLEFDKIVANIPYAICEPLMRSMMTADFSLAVLTVPQGFAGILAASKGSGAFSRLSLMSQALFDIDVLFSVPEKAFRPEPDTKSVVIRIRPKAGSAMARHVLARERLKAKNAIMRALFSCRKMTKNEAREAIKRLKINNELLEKRLNDLDLVELDAVLESLEKLGKGI